MSYCVNCGVELADSEKRCPLCETEVYHPNRPVSHKTPFPAHISHNPQEVSRSSLVELLTLIFLIPVLLCLVIDVRINDEVLWSGYVLGSFLQIHVSVAVPLLLSRKPSRHNAIIALGVDAVFLAAFLCYIQVRTGGEWFWSFAFPLIFLGYLFLVLLIFLSRYTELTRLGITALTVMCFGGYCTAIELLINLAFHVREYLIWSIYPLITCLLTGAVLFYIDGNRALKEKLIRKFFI